MVSESNCKNQQNYLSRFSESLRYTVSLIIAVSLLMVLSCFITVLSEVVVSVVSLLHANKTEIIRSMKHNFFIVQIFVKKETQLYCQSGRISILSWPCLYRLMQIGKCDQKMPVYWVMKFTLILKMGNYRIWCLQWWRGLRIFILDLACLWDNFRDLIATVIFEEVRKEISY